MVKKIKFMSFITIDLSYQRILSLLVVVTSIHTKRALEFRPNIIPKPLEDSKNRWSTKGQSCLARRFRIVQNKLKPVGTYGAQWV